MSAKLSTKRFFMFHNEDMRRLLNVKEVISFLNKQLLTPDESERVQSHAYVTNNDKVDYLVRILGLKGQEAPSLFIECLKQANEHKGHDELVILMEASLSAAHQPATPTTNGAGVRVASPLHQNQPTQIPQQDYQQTQRKRSPSSDVTIAADLRPPPLSRTKHCVSESPHQPTVKRSAQSNAVVGTDLGLPPLSQTRHCDCVCHQPTGVNSCQLVNTSSFPGAQTLHNTAATNTDLTSATLSSNSTASSLPSFDSRFERGMGVPVEEEISHSQTLIPFPQKSCTACVCQPRRMISDETTSSIKPEERSGQRCVTDYRPPTLSQTRQSRSCDTTDSESFVSVENSQYYRSNSFPHPVQQQFQQCPHQFAQQYIPPSCTSPLQVLIESVKLSYKNTTLFNMAAGPTVKGLQFINLALVEKKRVNLVDAENDSFLKKTLHGHIDDIMKMKTDISLSGIFSYSTASRKLVLVEGAPGVGKTMLALKICQLWANGELLKEDYDLVLLVTLRRFQKMSSVKLSDLLVALQGNLCEQATDALLSDYGNKVLLILEGWDELPPELRKEGSLFYDIVQGSILPNVSVLVTSRPTVTADLYDYMDERHIEVLGFSSEQIIEYVCLHGDEMAETILKHLEKFPNVKALAHIPLTLSIICSVARKQSTLPHTLTELYKQHILDTLLDALKKKRSLTGISSLEKLPPEVKPVFHSLCTLALNGFKEKRFVYCKDDLEAVGLKPDSFDGYGLLNAPLTDSAAGFEQIYQFNHLSIQEYLAAFEIQRLENEERVALLDEFRDDKQFRNIWKFFSGITRLEDESFQKFLIKNAVRANRDQIFLLHCLYEANNPAISAKAAQAMKYFLNLGNMVLNTTDCLCVGHMITSAGGEWQVDLRGCNMGQEGLRIFKTALISFVESHDEDGFVIKRLDLTQNRITAESVHHVAEMIDSKIQLQALVLSSNPIRNEGVRTLATALKQPHTVTKMNTLHFSSCDLTEEGAFELAEVVKVSKSLKVLYIIWEPIGGRGVEKLVQALDNKYNRSLTELSLTSTSMTSVGLAALARVAPHNQTLEILRIDRNKFVGKDCELVATIIDNISSLVLIDLSKNPIGDEGFERVLQAMIARPSGSLTKLGVFGCGITHKGLKKLVELFSVTEKFAGIHLGSNALGDEGAQLIAEGLQQNSSQSVRQIRMDSTMVTDKGKKKLQEVCDSINSERGQDKNLNITYIVNAHLLEMRTSHPLSSY